jgi:hypothetical protein
MNRKWILFLSAPAIAATALVAACGDDDVVTRPKPDGGGGDTSTTPPDTGTPDTGGGDTGTDAGVETLTFTKVAGFTAAQGQLPEGIVVQGGTAIVGFAPLGKLVKVLPDGGTADFASFPTTSNTFTVGLALDPSNNVYAAVAATGATPLPTPGAYKVGPDGGLPLPYNISGAAMTGFNNGFDFIGTDLYVSDSSGKIFKVDAAGAATEWKADPALVGDVAACSSQNGFPIGVNGIAHDDNFVYGVNLDKGAFFRIKRETNGSAGALEVLHQNCDFFGADGLVRDTDGTFIVANNPKNRIDRVTVSGTTATFHTIGSGAPLDGPASVFIEGTGASKKLWVTNSAFGSSAVDGGNPQPSVVTAPIK